MQFNPLRWKRHHLVAALGFVVLGAVAGLVLGAYFAELKVANVFQEYPASAALVADHIRMRLTLTWSGLFAGFTAIAVYCVQLMRA